MAVGLGAVDVSSRMRIPRRGESCAHLPLIVVVVIGAVARVWWSLAYPLSYDESFTAMVGRQSPDSIFDYLRHSDVHPPLDFILRSPLAQLGASDAVFRLPSVLLSTSALALFAWWMRDRGRLGLIATVLLAVSPFQIGYGSEARMYAMLELCGVAAAVLADRWLRTDDRRLAPITALVVAVALFDHVSGFLLAAALLALPGWRSDSSAWRWRSWVLAAIGLWAVLWGTAFAQQRNGSQVERIPYTTPARVVAAVSNMVSFTEGVTVVVVICVLVGGWLLVRRDRILGRVWIVLGGLPVLLAALAGLATHSFMDRTVTVAAWAPVLAVAAAADALLERSGAWRALAAVGLVLLVVPGTTTFLLGTWGDGVSTEQVAGLVRRGDVVAIVPAWYQDLIDWGIGVHGPAGSHAVSASVPDAAGVVVGPTRQGHRTWLLTLATNKRDYAQFPRCAPDQRKGAQRLLCLVTPS